MGEHIVNGEFQSDKYPWCKPGFVPLKLTDPMAQPVLWEYANVRRSVDAEFADDLQQALATAGYEPAICWLCDGSGATSKMSTARETPAGKSCPVKTVDVHVGCMMDMAQ